MAPLSTAALRPSSHKKLGSVVRSGSVPAIWNPYNIPGTFPQVCIDRSLCGEMEYIG